MDLVFFVVKSCTSLLTMKRMKRYGASIFRVHGAVRPSFMFFMVETGF